MTLHSVDEDIYKDFRKTFPALRVDVVSEDELKSKEAKDLWRDLIMRFQGKIEDFNYGTLLRADCAKDYTEENTILGIFCFVRDRSFTHRMFLLQLDQCLAPSSTVWRLLATARDTTAACVQALLLLLLAHNSVCNWMVNLFACLRCQRHSARGSINRT